MTDFDNAGGIPGTLKTLWGKTPELKNVINIEGKLSKNVQMKPGLIIQ